MHRTGCLLTGVFFSVAKIYSLAKVLHFIVIITFRTHQIMVCIRNIITTYEVSRISEMSN